MVIDIVLVLLIVFFAWRGFKKGFLGAVLGLIAVIAAIYGASLVAKTYSDNFTGVFEPFVGGVVDKAFTNTVPDVENEAAEDTGASKVFDVSSKLLQSIGVSNKASDLLADKVDDQVHTVGQQLADSLTEKLSQMIAYIVVFAVAFLVIAIAFAIIGKLINLVHILPGIETADRLIGLILGLLKGALVVFAIAVIIRYLGLLSPEAVEKTTFLKYITNMNPLADILGI